LRLAKLCKTVASHEAAMRQALHDSGLMDYEIRGAIEKLEEALK
jgi:hypothetical protein